MKQRRTTGKTITRKLMRKKLKKRKKKSEKPFIWERAEEDHVFRHWQESHAGEAMPRFGARVLRFHKTSMSRQISESTLLWRWSKRGDLQILNQKGMFNRCHLARLVVEERVQHEKIDNPGEVIEGKGDQKPEDDKKSKGTPNENESKPRASETTGCPTIEFSLCFCYFDGFYSY